jgi:DNA repair protein RecN (Recombination protein N)
MLRFLSIKRLAVIDSVEVEFEPGLNVLTGETGAGKSILVEAVGLLLGGRASGDLVRTGADQAVVEAIFESGGEELLVRREITAQGRSRAFVNGTLVTAGALKDLAARLIELHGQHEHQTLLDPSTHLGLIDAFGALGADVDRTATAYTAWRGAQDALDAAVKAAADRESRLEWLAFQLDELDKVDPRAGEDDALAARRQVLASAERLERLCAESYGALYEQEGAALATLGQVWRRVGELAAVDPRFQPYVDARDGIKAQLEDLAVFLRRYTDTIDASPEALQQVEDRLARLERLKRKHGPDLAAVIARREALRREVDDLARSDERVAALGREAQAARRAFLAAADALSAARRRAAAAFAPAMERELAALAMEQTRFEMRFEGPLPQTAWTARGVDAAECFLSPNPGEELRPLARIVSGGELSRIMLAIKTLTATSRHGFSVSDERPPSASAPGLIFDEVDAGIGGRVADVVGRKLRVLGSAFQVLCITHLPQVAAAADAHYQIEKRVEEGRTRTTVQRITRDDRVEEIARMLGGEAVSDGVRRTARELLERREGPPPGLKDGARAPRRDGAKGEAIPKGESESGRGRGQAASAALRTRKR